MIDLVIAVASLLLYFAGGLVTVIVGARLDPKTFYGGFSDDSEPDMFIVGMVMVFWPIFAAYTGLGSLIKRLMNRYSPSPDERYRRQDAARRAVEAEKRELEAAHNATLVQMSKLELEFEALKAQSLTEVDELMHPEVRDIL